MFNIKIFEEYLDEEIVAGKLSGKTKKYYLAQIKKMNKLCCNVDVARSSAVILEHAIEQLCNGNKQAAKYVAAIKKYERVVLQAPGTLLYGEPLSRIRQKAILKKTCGKKLKHQESTYAKKINRLENERLKLAFRLQEKSGLRVSEIAALSKADIVFNQGKIELYIRNGKGRKSRQVIVEVDPYLYEHLLAFISNCDSDRLFYSEAYLIKKANEHGMETHDLRRINARRRFRKARCQGDGKRAARRAVATQLGHIKPSTTNLYLGNEWSDNVENEVTKDENN